MAERKVDRRVRKTKRQLRQALTTLMKEKPIQEIKVREIADLIDINRGTFYKYYRDIYDMLYKIEEEIFDQFNAVIEESEHSTSPGEVKPLLIKIFTLLKENADLAIALMGPNGDPVFVDKVKTMIKKRCIDDWMLTYESESPVYFEYYYAFVVAGCIGLFQRWLEDGAQETPEELADLVEQMILRGLNVK